MRVVIVTAAYLAFASGNVNVNVVKEDGDEICIDNFDGLSQGVHTFWLRFEMASKIIFSIESIITYHF